MIFPQAFPSLSSSNFHRKRPLTQDPSSNVLIGNTDKNILDKKSPTYLVVDQIKLSKYFN